MNLQTPVKDAGRIFKMYSSRLEKLGIYKLEDFLYHIPFRYDDFSLISNIAQVQAGEIVTIQGQVRSIKNIFTKYGKKIQNAVIADDTGSINAVWFNQTYLTNYIHENDTISVSGKANIFNRKLTLTSPEYEIINDNVNLLHTGRLTPVYPETRGVSSKWIRRHVYKLLNEYKNEFIEYLPDYILDKYNFYNFFDALYQIHFPDNLENAEKARERLAFNELFILQLKAKTRRVEWENDLKGHQFSVIKYQKQIKEFAESVPFTLTNTQSVSIDEIYSDLTKIKPMNRLLQGDVGSGKTIVGIYAMYLAYLNGFQSVLMAPTEILAEQHFLSIKNFLEPFGVKIALVTGSKKPSTLNSEFSILIGTHAVLSEKIKFENLGLVIIDEQQRFGVEQRSVIRNKGKNPHFLTMTATPIPRTVALTMYGDLDISYLSELPTGRKKIKTWLVSNEKRNNAYEWIRKHVNNLNSQAFIICPFIEESENMQTIKAAKIEYERLKLEVFPDLKLDLLHGKQKMKEKEKILNDFRQNKSDILVATPVVEVGIDIPNATVIVIEAAERFGLAQLHQLRGRVGRGEKQSYCLLFTESPSVHTSTRLKSMESKHNGSELAELDLKLRGPGDIFGTKQSGLPRLKIADFSDFSLIQKSKFEADQIFTQIINFPELNKKVKNITLNRVSPD